METSKVNTPVASSSLSSGSGDPGPYLAIARIVKTQGRKGEVAAEILTDFPERFTGLRQALLGGESQLGAADATAPGKIVGQVDQVEIENAWPHKRLMVLKFSGVDSISQAERLVGRHLLIPRQERMPLPQHHYYLWELEGCRVLTERDGVQLGAVTKVESTGGVDILHVTRSGDRGGEILIPLAQSICTRIDTEAKIIIINPPDDLLELNS